MSETDFLTALAQLLRDGALRDEFAGQPQEVAARLARSLTDCAALARLSPGDLEAQAQVLLRKRFRAIEPLMPETCAALGAAAWSLFAQFARTTWPADPSADAYAFCELILRERRPAVSHRELHRLRFITRCAIFALHIVRKNSSAVPHLQILLRLRDCPREWLATLSW